MRLHPLLLLVLALAACSRGDIAGPEQGSVDPTLASDGSGAAATSGLAGTSTPVGPPPTQPVVESPLTWAFEAAPPYVVIEEGGVVYLQVENVPLLEHEHLEQSQIPDTWQDGETTRGATFPYAGPALAVPEIALATSDGRCVPALGEPVWVNRTQCNLNAALAFPLSGCSGVVGPFAWPPHALPEDVRWVPSPTSQPQDWDVVQDRSSSVADWAESWRSEYATHPEYGALPVSGRYQDFTVQAGTESLQVHYAVAQSSPSPADECEIFCQPFERALLQPSAQEIAVRGPVLGVFANAGEVAGVVTGTDNYRQLYARNDAGTISKHFDVMHRSDSDECIASLFPLVCDEPCGL